MTLAPEAAGDPVIGQNARPGLQIALATHNGGRFLPALLRSLEAQTVQNFRLLVADDGSTDDTLELLEALRARRPGQVEILRFEHPAGGASANFARLIDRLDCDYAMFCDQDDVWLPHKVAVSLERIQALEGEIGPQAPIAVHTDLVITGSDLSRLHDSYWGYANLKPASNSFRRLLLQNTMTGCASIVNRALYRLARPIPPDAMYDGWIALTAAAFGRVEAIREAPILHRRHDANASTMDRWSSRLVLGRAVDTIAGGTVRAGLNGMIQQVQAFHERFASRLAPQDAQAARAVATLWSQGRLERCVTAIRYGPLKTGVLRNLGLLVALMIG